MNEEGQVTPELSLREELAENLMAVQPTEALQAEIKDVPEGETPEQTASRIRDEKGRFAAKDTQVAPPVEKPIEAAVKPPTRPSSWKKDFWQDYDKIAAENPKLAAYLNEREGQFASGVSTYKQEWEQAKPLIDAIAPFQPILQQNGIDPAQWISNLGNAHHKLVMSNPQDKVALFQKLAQDYNVPVQLAVQGPNGWQLLGQQQMQPQFDPSVIPKMVQQELQATQTKQQLESFTKEAPTKYPHFEAVKATMAGLLQAGLAEDLPGAYEAALRHPRHNDLFSELQQQQSAQQEAEARAAKTAKVQRARANTVSTPSATPSGQMNAGGEKGLRETITESLRAAVGGRV